MTDRLITCDDHMDLSQLPADLWTTRLHASLLDRAPHVEERRGQPRGPQIRRQLAEIHVIVAGDEPLRHVILRSMDVSPRRAATGRSYRVPPLSRTHYPYLELQVLERDGDRLEARPFLGSSDQIIEAARAALKAGLGEGDALDHPPLRRARAPAAALARRRSGVTSCCRRCTMRA